MKKEQAFYPLKTCHGDRIRTPIYVLAVIVAILKQYFGTTNRISMEESKYLWKEDQGESDLYVSEEFAFEPLVAGKRPAILIGLDGQTFPRLAMADLLYFDPTTSTSHHVAASQSAVRFRCMHESMLGAMELATELKYFVDVFRLQIQDSYCFDTFRAAQASSPQKIEEYKDYWIVDLVCELKYQEKWGVTLEHLRVKSVAVDLRISPFEEKNGLAQHQLG